MSGVIRTVPCGCESGQPCTPATRCAITTAVHIQREDDEAEMERLREDHEAELAALRERAERAEAALLRKGYRMSCDIPACNCGDQWTHGGHAEMRLTEIREALEQADARRNGETLLADVVHIAARAERATTIEAELATLRAERDALRAAGEAALRTLDNVRVFVTSRERIHKPSGEEWFEGCVKALRAALEER